MASTASLEGVKKAVFFPFQGKNWAGKVLIGVLVSLGSFLVVPAIIVVGYAAQIMKQVILKDEDPALPEWSDWEHFLLDGLKVYGVVLIYSLPGIILFAGGWFLSFALNIGFSLATIPLSQNSNSPSLALPIFGSMGGMFFGLAVAMFGMLVLIITALIIPPAVGNMIAKSEFSAAFKFREWWPVFKANVGGYLLAFAIAAGLFTLVYTVMMFFYMTVVLCFLVPFILVVIIFPTILITYTLYAVAYRDGIRSLKDLKINSLTV